MAQDEPDRVKDEPVEETPVEETSGSAEEDPGDSSQGDIEGDDEDVQQEAVKNETAEDVSSKEPEQGEASGETVTEYSGSVLNPMGVPVEGAIVRVPALGLEATSDAAGEFSLAVQPGEHFITVEAPGMAPLEEKVVFDESAVLSGVELLMEYPMEDVVVTGTKTKKLIEKAPVKTTVVGREEIERKKATNLAESLESQTGVRVENNCQNCSFTQVRLNGLEGRYTQILIDGNPVISSLAGVYGLEQIPQEMIERVEIVKGGGSALYGGNAVGGVVNVITSRPTKSFANATLRGGALGMEEPEMRVGANAGIVSDEKSMALHVYGGASHSSPWDANGDGFSEIGRARRNMFGADAYLDVPRDGELQLKFHALHEKRRGGNAFGKPYHDAGITEATETDRYGGEIRFAQLLGAHFNYELGYGFAYTERDSYYGGGGDVALDDPPTAEQWEAKSAALGAYGRTKNPVHTANATANIAYSALGEQIVTVGAQFMSDSLDDRFPGYGRKTDELYWDIAGILQHDWMMNEYVETVLGVRLDKHSELQDVVLSPRAALMITPFDWLRSRSSFSSGFRAPQVFDEDLHITIVGGEGQIITNDPDLDPERSFSLSQQFEADFEFDNGLELETGLGGFWTRINDAFVLDEQDDPSTVGELEMLRRNRGKTTVYGAEVEARLSWRSFWGIGAGWTWESAENSEKDPDFDSKKIFRTPWSYGFVQAWTRPTKGLELSTAVDFTGPMSVPHYAGYIDEDRLEESPWFADWSANASYKFDLDDSRYITPFIGIKNILDSRQDDYDVGPDRDAGYFYGPRLPRTFFAGIKGGI